MLCLACGEEMRLVQITKDTTIPVSGYEHHTWQCSACSTVERRMSPAYPKVMLKPAPLQLAIHGTLDGIA